MEACLDRLRDTQVSLEEVLSNTVTPNLKATGKITELKEKLQDIAEGEGRKTHKHRQ